ncbi:MAG: hypothetical protein NDI73_04105 [Desulfuromonadales bacterium]|nr:hypothetical protein [Desulfuromonadales bacterium]
MRRFIEIAYVIVSIGPLACLGLVIAQTEGSLVSGIVIGSVIPLLALISLLLVLTGAVLIFFARRRKDRIWHLVLATLLASPIAVLVGLAWLFG